LNRNLFQSFLVHYSPLQDTMELELCGSMTHLVLGKITGKSVYPEISGIYLGSFSHFFPSEIVPTWNRIPEISVL